MTNSSLITTAGGASAALVVQSLGGGGGVVSLTNNENIHLGGNNVIDAKAGDLNLKNSGNITTTGNTSPLIMAQSIGGGGGYTTLNSAKDIYKIRKNILITPNSAALKRGGTFCHTFGCYGIEDCNNPAADDFLSDTPQTINNFRSIITSPNAINGNTPYTLGHQRPTGCNPFGPGQMIGINFRESKPIFKSSGEVISGHLPSSFKILNALKVSFIP